jgi:hypothetical protein
MNMIATLHADLLPDCIPDDDVLRHAEGFQVYGPDGRIGHVVRVEESDHGVDLVIGTGLFRRLMLVAHDYQVDEVHPTRGRIIVTGIQRRRPA